MNFCNIIRNSLKGENWKVIIRKLWVRVFDGIGSSPRDAREWYAANALDFDKIFDAEDTLYKESIEWDANLNREASFRLNMLNVRLGGGGNCALLYYLVRKLKPQVVVETGVAAGFSSKTILYAQKLNGFGHLYSSDFPYFRIHQPEKFIGILVDSDLKENWDLYISGDSKNLINITKDLGSKRISLFHYDSDKSYSGRQSAYKLVAPVLCKDAVVIFDDIVDNSHFKDTITNNSHLFYRIIKYHGKLVGIFSKNKDAISIFQNSKY